MRRPYTDLSTPPRCGDAPVGARFVPPDGGQWKRGQFGLNLPTDREICGAVFPVFGVFAVNNRGRWLFTWRCLRTGRRMRRPYTDLSTPPRVGCTRRRPFRSSGWGTVEKGTVWFKPGAVAFVCAAMTIGDHLGKSAVRHSPCPGYSRSTIGVDGRSPGGLYILGDACVAPTQIYRPHRGWDALDPVPGRFMGAVVFVPR